MKNTRASIIHFFLIHPLFFFFLNLFLFWVVDFFNKFSKDVIEIDAKRLIKEKKDHRLKRIIRITEQTFSEKGFKFPDFFGFYQSGNPDSRITFGLQGISLFFSSSFLKFFNKRDMKSVLIREVSYLINQDFKFFFIIRWLIDVFFWTSVLIFNKERFFSNDKKEFLLGEFISIIFYFYVFVILTNLKYFREKEYSADLTVCDLIGKKSAISPLKKVLNLRNKENLKNSIKYDFKSSIYKKPYILRYFFRFLILKSLILNIFSSRPLLEERILRIKRMNKE